MRVKIHKKKLEHVQKLTLDLWQKGGKIELKWTEKVQKEQDLKGQIYT